MIKVISKNLGADLKKEVIYNSFNLTDKNFGEFNIHKKFFDLSPDMLCILGYDGLFKKVNPSFERTLGYKADELISRAYSEFIVLEDHESTLTQLKGEKTEDSTIHFENRYRAKDGSIKWIAWRYTTIPEEKHIYAIARDITSQKKIELELRGPKRKIKRAYKIQRQRDCVMDSFYRKQFLTILIH